MYNASTISISHQSLNISSLNMYYSFIGSSDGGIRWDGKTVRQQPKGLAGSFGLALAFRFYYPSIQFNQVIIIHKNSRME